MDYEVIVIGGGPVGLGAAIALGRRGISTAVFERHETTSFHPRGHIVNARSVEILREWGLADEVLSASVPHCRNRGSVFVTHMAGEEFGSIVLHGDSSESDAEVESWTPHRKASCPQDLLEPILLRGAQSLPDVDVRFGTTVIELTDGPDSASLKVADASGKQHTVTARYVIAADGARSFVRRELGIESDGVGRMGSQIGIYFHADLWKYIEHRPYLLWWVYNNQTSGVVIALDGRTRWTYNFAYDPQCDAPESFTRQRCVDIVRAAVGDPDLDVDIRSVTPWSMQARLASTMRRGNVFLAGDAAHPLPPTGGQGMNTGLADVHNLAWKLAAVLRGHARQALLDTYDAERLPIARFNVDQSVRNAQSMAEAGLGGMLRNDDALIARVASMNEHDRAEIAALVAAQRDHFDNHGQVLGVVYRSAAVVGGDPPSTTRSISHYSPNATPGARAPHLWLDSEHTLSTVDLFSTSPMTLLTTPGAAPTWEAELGKAARNAAVRLLTIGDGGDYPDLECRFDSLYGVGTRGAVLVRQDGHVAWRTVDGPHSIDTVLEQILGPTLITRTLADTDKPIPPNRLAHIVFRTNQLDTMIQWYNTVLGGHTVFSDEHIAFLTYDDEHHRVALIASKEFAAKPYEASVGFYHAAFTFADMGALLSTWSRLRDVGITPQRCLIHGPTVSMYYADPDGNDIELQFDVFDDAHDATAWMMGEVFSANPIGTPFDPVDLSDRYCAGEPVASLVRRTDDPIPA